MEQRSARQSHKLEVGGSNPLTASNLNYIQMNFNFNKDCEYLVDDYCVKQNCKCIYDHIISGTERPYITNKGR